jgi:hypothetical protein
MKHICEDSERNAEYAQKKDDREAKQEDQKMNFATAVSKVPSFIRPPSFQQSVGKCIGEATTAELRKYVELIAT